MKICEIFFQLIFNILNYILRVFKLNYVLKSIFVYLIIVDNKDTWKNKNLKVFSWSPKKKIIIIVY